MALLSARSTSCAIVVHRLYAVLLFMKSCKWICHGVGGCYDSCRSCRESITDKVNSSHFVCKLCCYQRKGNSEECVSLPLWSPVLTNLPMFPIVTGAQEKFGSVLEGHHPLPKASKREQYPSIESVSLEIIAWSCAAAFLARNMFGPLF